MTRNTMMATPSYYGGNAEQTSFQYSYHRPAPYRPMSTAAYYDRQTPYAYHEPMRQELRMEHVGRPVTRAMISAPETEFVPGANGNSRRRIAVACSRCRRRKIKCSGDPGDGSGCQACRTATSDTSTCTFIRVGAYELSRAGNAGIEPYPQASSAPQSASYGPDPPNNTGWNHSLHARPSLPTLHTRSSWMDNYDQYDSSHVDAYTYASSAVPRQDSYASSYGSLESYRSWSTTGSISAPVPASCFEQPQSYSFGSLHAPAHPTSTSGRLPSVSGEIVSPLNMGSLHSSLPLQTVQERRLPAPYTVQYPPQNQYPSVPVPEVRPLGSFTESRMPMNEVYHGRQAMPWPADSAAAVTRTAASTSSHGVPTYNVMPQLQQQHNHHHHHQHQPHPGNSTPAFDSTVLGYQFSFRTNHTAPSGSPEVSPSSGPTLSDTNPSTASTTSSTASMPPPSHFGYTGPQSQQAPSVTAAERPMTADAPGPSLYSFGLESSETAAIADSEQASGCTAIHIPFPRQSNLHHVASEEAMVRQPSFEQQSASTHTHPRSVLCKCMTPTAAVEPQHLRFVL
ncbi:hypothetical protein BAUCODRAFT_22250 [Baudoinia panamericana UAMH 10762]|uniref:Zn(2)-C6 fungal-type domain-containing protein n=1 Tax=Baudoinia panamericana (strain UAMH 10762) TaxID=717646 RepID=M2N4N0_BAUPA|nr:uncharacterized protein BAUCODRAFT_22250 [Baudoinia panamericana UAMH 10762]EMC98938.1 hypothetical protein BAUCODRAFT_22250 [Baudoinia panamericana UAMH 10762]